MNRYAIVYKHKKKYHIYKYGANLETISKIIAEDREELSKYKNVEVVEIIKTQGE